MTQHEHKPSLPSDRKPSILYCPVGNVFSPCEISELKAVVEHLKRDEPVDGQAVFPRGTHLADGRLDLCKQSIGPVGGEVVAAALQSNSHTRHWLLGANGLGDQGARAVAKTTAANENLETIYLGCNLIESEGATDLADALTENDHVTGLWLKRNPIGPEGAAQIASMLRSNTTLRTLDLVHTQIGREGIEVIAKALTQPVTSIKRLYLGGNRITVDHIEPICEMIRVNRSIHSLYLGVNRLGDAGASKIAEAVAENDSLQTLSLSANDIGPNGAFAIAEQLQNHPTLRLLDLGKDLSAPVLGEKLNRIGDQGAQAIAELIQTNSVLRIIDLQGNQITSVGAELLIAALESNNTLISIRLGKGISKSIKKRMAQLLDHNAKSLPRFVEPDHQDIQVIKSVYRTPVPGLSGIQD